MSERPFTFEELALGCQKMAVGKRIWLENFSDGRAKRPDHEISYKREELAMLELMRADYLDAADRIAARQTARKTG